MDNGQVGLLWDAVTTVPTVGATWATPAFLAALATLVTALTGLVVALKTLGRANTTADSVEATKGVVHDTAHTVNQVAVQTNGVLDTLQARVAALEGKATPAQAPPPAH